MKSIYLFVVVVILSACEAHRHHLDHHGRHHDGESRREHLKHHPNHDLKVTLADLATPKNETISIDVTRKETRPDNEKNTIRVSLRIHTIKGFVHINGHKVDHTVVTSVHVRTIVDEFSPAGMVLRRPGVVQVRVMVTESTNPNGMKMLAIQEEIVEVAGDEVEQINVKEILLEFTRSAQEDRRSITIIKLTKSKIHKHARKDDKHLWAHKGRLPKDPFCVSKDEMRRWKQMHRRPPTFELGRNKDEDFDRDGDDDRDGKEAKSHGKHHHHHRHHSYKHWGRRFCRWFHKLPVATRAAFGIAVVLFGILIVTACWTCCCRKPKAKPDAKCELGDTASVDLECEADAIPEKKKPLDEQPLVA